jgi:phospholipase B1, membrane-associated
MRLRIELFWIIFIIFNTVKCLKNIINKTPSNKPNIDEYYTNWQNFNCTIISPSENVTSVHKLRISDIKAVAALGDSLSTAVGADAENFLNSFYAFRGSSFSAGGVESLETIVTLPNTMKKYNKNLIGYSNDTDQFHKKSSNSFNLATAGDEAIFILTQAKELVRRMKNSKDFDYKNEWKLITIFFGSLDLCDYCSDKKLNSAQKFVSYIKKGLNILYNELPKTFVNIIAPMKVHKVSNTSLSTICTLSKLRL